MAEPGRRYPHQDLAGAGRVELQVAHPKRCGPRIRTGRACPVQDCRTDAQWVLPASRPDAAAARRRPADVLAMLIPDRLRVRSESAGMGDLTHDVSRG